MNRQEFESLAMRNGKSISQTLFDSIERFYMDTDEPKGEFVKRFFGGKCNTVNSVIKKVSMQAIRENRMALSGNKYATESRLVEMDNRIAEHYQIIATRCI